MRTDFKRELLGHYNLEILICFVTSMALLYSLLSRPETDVMKAVVNNDLIKIKRLIAESKDLDEPGQCRETHSFYSTPLIEAARLGRTDIAVELLDAGANVSARDEYGTSPLLAALSKGNVHLSILFLKKGADPNVATCVGHGSCSTALRCARRIGNAQLIDEIVSLGGREDTSCLFPLECAWVNMRPILLFSVTRIVPLVCLVMFSGSLLRRLLGGNRP